jgi:hypothetical protein
VKVLAWIGCLLGIVPICALLTGCAGATYQDGVYRNEELAFRIAEPAGTWRNLELEGTALARRSDEAQATLALQGRCRQDGDDVPLQSLTHHLFLQFADRVLVSQVDTMLDGRAALRTELDAKLDGVAKEFIVTVLKKDGCVYDFMMIAAPGARAGATAAYDQWLASFHTLGGKP